MQKGRTMNRLPLLLLLAIALTACGQKASTRTTAVTPAPVASGPLLVRTASDLHCGKQPAVWANERTKIYHLPGDPYYGHTKEGGYLCEGDAVRAGYRSSKTPVSR